MEGERGRAARGRGKEGEMREGQEMKVKDENGSADDTGEEGRKYGRMD